MVPVVALSRRERELKSLPRLCVTPLPLGERAGVRAIRSKRWSDGINSLR
jgi:hypothetical protein